MKPHLIMPMGGAGSRFYKDGYIMPKPLIIINGKPFFYWAVMSIMHYVDIADLTFVVLKQHVDEKNIDGIIKNFFPNAKIVIIPEVLPGPVFTALEGVANIDDSAPIIFNDCDHMFKCSSLYKLLNEGTFDAEGALLTFESSEPQFSYVQYEENRIIGTVEKKVVSNKAICGAYVFKNVQTFLDNARVYIQDCPYSECFMSGIYNVMCRHGLEVKDYLLDYHVEYGTPLEFEKAKVSPYFNDLDA